MLGPVHTHSIVTVVTEKRELLPRPQQRILSFGCFCMVKTGKYTLDTQAFKSLFVLGLMQVIAMTTASLVILVGGIVGERMAPTSTLATMPVAAMVIGTAIFSIPAALLMQHVGRRAGFALAMFACGFSALLAAVAVEGSHFWLFCAATAFIGANLAFAAQYRFAAAELVDPKESGKTVSLLLFCGIGGGILGPVILALDVTPMSAPTDAFGILFLLCMVTAMVFGLFYRNVCLSHLEEPQLNGYGVMLLP